MTSKVLTVSSTVIFKNFEIITEFFPSALTLYICVKATLPCKDENAKQLFYLINKKFIF